jgi:hypothetical protein
VVPDRDTPRVGEVGVRVHAGGAALGFSQNSKAA